MKKHTQPTLFELADLADLAQPTPQPTGEPIQKTSHENPDDHARTEARQRTSRETVKRRVRASALNERLAATGYPAPQPHAKAGAQESLKAELNIAEASGLTVLDGWAYYLTLPRTEGSTLINADRSKSDLGNRRRALLDAVMGYAQTGELAAVPLSFLARDLEALNQDLMRGALARLGYEPDPKKAANLRSDLKSVRSALSQMLSLPGVAPKPASQRRTPRKGRYQKGFRADQWPAGLRAELDQMRVAFTDPHYTGPGHRFLNRHRLRKTSFDNVAIRLNRLVDFLVNKEEVQNLRLQDLLNFTRFLRFRTWYFEQVTEGGYKHYQYVCSAVTKVAIYLEAIEALESGFDMTSKHPDAPWMVFIAEGRMTMHEGHRTQKHVEAEAIPLRTPFELDALAKRCKTIPPLTSDGRAPSGRQLFQRRFAAMFFGLGIYMPLRGRNWQEMKWGRNLWQDKEGKWHVKFVGDELKNGSYQREGKIRTYELQLPERAGEWIAWWREQLRAFIGENFEEVTPWVFPMLSTLMDGAGNYLWTIMSHKYFIRCVDDAALEGLDQRFRPHILRHCVATFIVASGRIEDAQQAATLLGDTMNTVLKMYFKPDEQKFLDQGYYATLAL